MSDQTSSVVTGMIIEEHSELTLEDVSRFCTVRQDRVVALVEEGILEPAGAEPTQWRFPENSLQRAARALRIQRDFEVNLAGVALVLDLLDEIEELRAAMRRIPGALST